MAPNAYSYEDSCDYGLTMLWDAAGHMLVLWHPQQLTLMLADWQHVRVFVYICMCNMHL